MLFSRPDPDRVRLVPYDPDWPQRFEEERRVLGPVFAGTNTLIEHVGSTAVPGLGSKPVIDIVVGVPALAVVEVRIPALEAVGYEYVQHYEAQIPERRYFRKPRLGTRTLHLHCVASGSDIWIQYLAFRDYLRAHPHVAAAYNAYKEDLAARVSKAEYTEAKSPFIREVLAAAMAQRPLSTPPHSHF